MIVIADGKWEGPRIICLLCCFMKSESTIVLFCFSNFIITPGRTEWCQWKDKISGLGIAIFGITKTELYMNYVL